MTPIVPPPLGCCGCIPGPPMVGLMPGIGPPFPPHSFSAVLIGGDILPAPGGCKRPLPWLSPVPGCAPGWAASRILSFIAEFRNSLPWGPSMNIAEKTLIRR